MIRPVRGSWARAPARPPALAPDSPGPEIWGRGGGARSSFLPPPGRATRPGAHAAFGQPPLPPSSLLPPRKSARLAFTCFALSSLVAPPLHPFNYPCHRLRLAVLSPCVSSSDVSTRLDSGCAPGPGGRPSLRGRLARSLTCNTWLNQADRAEHRPEERVRQA